MSQLLVLRLGAWLDYIAAEVSALHIAVNRRTPLLSYNLIIALAETPYIAADSPQGSSPGELTPGERHISPLKFIKESFLSKSVCLHDS